MNLYLVVLAILTYKQKHNMPNKHFIVFNKNDVLQYKWPMIGQYTFYHWSIKIYTVLSLVILLIHYKLLPYQTKKLNESIINAFLCCLSISFRIKINFLLVSTWLNKKAPTRQTHGFKGIIVDKFTPSVHYN